MTTQNSSAAIRHSEVASGTNKLPMRWVASDAMANNGSHSDAGAYAWMAALPKSLYSGDAFVVDQTSGNIAQFRFAHRAAAPDGTTGTFAIWGVKESRSPLSPVVEYEAELVCSGTLTCGASVWGAASQHLTVPSGESVGLVDTIVVSVDESRDPGCQVRGDVSDEWAMLEFDATNNRWFIVEVRSSGAGVYVQHGSY